MESSAEKSIGSSPSIGAWRADVNRNLRNLNVKSGPSSLIQAILAIMPSLDAAMFVTECSHVAHDTEKSSWGDIAFGRVEALAHLMDHMDHGGLLDDSNEPCSINPEILSFLPSGSSAVVSLVTTLGLDEDMTSALDMDKAGAAFVCELCEPHTLLPGGGQLRTIFSWRQAAIHLVDRLRFGQTEHFDPSWRLLTDRELRALKLAEEKCELEPSYPQWVRCNQCLGQRFDARSEKSMMEHLRSVHDLSEPVLGQDFYYHPLKAGSLVPVHRICVEPAPDAAVRIRSIGQVGTKLSYSELDYRRV
ncbi:hypothetical protein LXA43DRAFT_1137719 [Ganoderma leucocontextum]|nr:hypothetical protein LXA43DRAFT_1137719 [Ganoderma leucocontextum]